MTTATKAHGSATGPLIEVIPRRGEVVEFNPERYGSTLAALDYGIKEVKRIRDWPKLEEAVDLKIEEQRRFVAWWGATVQRPGGDRQSQHSPRTRLMLCSEAERRFVIMIDSAQKRGELIRHLEDALALADEIQDGQTGFLIERALDEARSHQFRLIG
jgi:hypothetical protein